MAQNTAQKDETFAFDIVDIDDPKRNAVLTTPMVLVNFPLSQEDRHFIEALKKKVLELGAAGLAATQVGVGKPITAFQVPEDALKWRDNITHLAPISVLINPSYEGIEIHGKILDWEGCYSAKNYYGKIWRWKAVQYKGHDEQGCLVEGKAYGFLARLLQHEIDHCHHKMCIDLFDATSPQDSQEKIMSLRKLESGQKKQSLGLSEDDPFPLKSIEDIVKE